MRRHVAISTLTVFLRSSCRNRVRVSVADSPQLPTHAASTAASATTWHDRLKLNIKLMMLVMKKTAWRRCDDAMISVMNINVGHA